MQASRRGPRGADEGRRMAADDGCEREGKGQHMQRERRRECEREEECAGMLVCRMRVQMQAGLRVGKAGGCG